tara:strand:- start:1265 stop:1858 length:594 start_codon:yes stop_codon:yes gene_type:complete
MIIVKHKVNTLLNLDKIPKNYGVEVDIRLNNKKFILSHYNNSQKNKTYLGKFLKKFNHSYLILNLKEQHLAKKLLNFMKKKKIKNFFLLDLFPHEIIKIKSKKNICTRFSYYEDWRNLDRIKKFSKWVWVDFLDKKKITQHEFKTLKKFGFKICIVSPEVAGYKNLKLIKNFILYLKKNKIYPEMVCTKKNKLWSSF